MLFQLNASVGGSFNSAFSTGASSVSQLQEKINSLNRTSADISSYQKQQSAIDKTKAKIELYQTQLQNLQNATATTSKEEAELAKNICGLGGFLGLVIGIGVTGFSTKIPPVWFTLCWLLWAFLLVIIPMRKRLIPPAAQVTQQQNSNGGQM